MRHQVMDCDQEKGVAEEKRGVSRKRRRSLQVEKDKEENVGRRRRYKNKSVSSFFDEEAAVDDEEEEEEEEEGKDDFIVEGGADLPEEVDGRRMCGSRVLPYFKGDHNDLEAMAASIKQRYGRRLADYDEENTYVEQAFLPSVNDSKLWMVKCAIGHERKTAVCLMQKCMDKGSELKIRSAIALDHLKNYIYVEADKEAHVREACKGLCNLFGQKLTLVPIREMTAVLSVESKAANLARDARVRRTKGRELVKKRSFVPPPRINEARELQKKQFMIGDFVLVVKGDLKNLRGWVEKVDDDVVHIRPKNEGLPKTLTVNKKELCKYFEPGNHVKVVAGSQEGATGMVVKVEQHVLVLISDTTKDEICVFADHVMECSGVIMGGSSSNSDRKSDVYSRFSVHGTSPSISPSLRRFRGGGPTRKIAIC